MHGNAQFEYCFMFLCAKLSDAMLGVLRPSLQTSIPRCVRSPSYQCLFFLISDPAPRSRLQPTLNPTVSRCSIPSQALGTITSLNARRQLYKAEAGRLSGLPSCGTHNINLRRETDARHLNGFVVNCNSVCRPRR